MKEEEWLFSSSQRTDRNPPNRKPSSLSSSATTTRCCPLAGAGEWGALVVRVQHGGPLLWHSLVVVGRVVKREGSTESLAPDLC